ncbi:uncharacterized protein A4U43_C07F13990 [Asparagus officinalis]|uniref:Uncharacterized protein n=1 Tax=Asparagus officinalis TaxID=4686 RepID=A0A5P1EBS4_ASPOF|nr:uncharacterized protein A4U43_C07F13990 [Asparagus officinalis]
MTSKTLLFAVVLLMIASASSAQAQLLGLSQLLINGTVHCSVGPGSANTAVFPIVTTPLSTCDAPLPTSGLLQSALQLLNGGGLIGGLLGLITNIVPSGFSLVQ